MKLIPESAKERILYNKKTGELIWKKENKSHPRLTGKPAGSKNGNYLVVKLDGIQFKAHRVAWFIATGCQPNIIDHINGDTVDNRFCNLRNVTANENAKNHGKGKRKDGMPCGVRLLPSGRFQARVSCDKKQKTIGTFDTISDAEKAAIDARKQLFGEFSRLL